MRSPRADITPYSLAVLLPMQAICSHLYQYPPLGLLCRSWHLQLDLEGSHRICLLQGWPAIIRLSLRRSVHCLRFPLHLHKLLMELDHTLARFLHALSCHLDNARSLVRLAHTLQI